ncbi:hypothetical protein BDK51DRAFT_12265, partial [Blyttiomyces helicus]
ILLAFSIMFEPMRLWLGYSGNLRERVPELSAFFLFTLFPQFVTCVYLAFGQPFTAHGFATDLEVAVNIAYLLMLGPELVLGWRAAKNVVDAQAARFFLTL